MRVISIKRLRAFWEVHPDAEKPLRVWFKNALKSSWSNITETNAAYPQADAVKLDCGLVVTVFNIKGNHYRLVCTVDYAHYHIYVKKVMTHKEYDEEKWKVILCQE